MRVSDEIFLVEADVNEEVWGGPKVELNLGRWLMIEPNNKKHWTRVHFKPILMQKEN